MLLGSWELFLHKLMTICVDGLRGFSQLEMPQQNTIAGVVLIMDHLYTSYNDTTCVTLGHLQSGNFTKVTLHTSCFQMKSHWRLGLQLGWSLDHCNGYSSLLLQRGENFCPSGRYPSRPELQTLTPLTRP